MPKIKEVIIVTRGEIIPKTEKVKVLWECPHCHQEMGEVEGHNFYEDGASYFCHIWSNSCGHIAKYDELIRVEEPSASASDERTTKN